MEKPPGSGSMLPSSLNRTSRSSRGTPSTVQYDCCPMSGRGHTPGALSWRWDSCDGGVCRTIVYADSLTPMARKNYRFADHPAALAAFRASIARIAASPCDILLTPHPSGSDLRTRISAGKPLLDPDGCRAYAAGLSRALDERLATEATR